MSFQATFSSSTSASAWNPTETPTFKPLNPQAPFLLSFWVQIGRIGAQQLKTARTRHIGEIRTDLPLSQNIWRKPTHAWRSEQDYWFSIQSMLPASSQDYSHKAFSLLEGLQPGVCISGPSLLPWVRPWENWDQSHNVWLELLEEKWTFIILQWKKHISEEREGGRKEKRLFFPQPLLLPGGAGVWLIERDPVLILRHQVMESLPQLLIRLYLTSHLMHVYPFFFCLKMGTVTVPISCRAVVSLKLWRSVKHLRAIRVFCFSATGKRLVLYSTANGGVSKASLVFRWKQRRCPATEGLLGARTASTAKPTYAGWHAMILHNIPEIFHFAQAFSWDNPKLLNFWVLRVKTGSSQLQTQWGPLLGCHRCHGFSMDHLRWKVISSFILQPGKLQWGDKCSPITAPSPSRPHLCWTCN